MKQSKEKMYQQLRFELMTFFRIVKPWKKRLDIGGDEHTYAKGWNDCIKEIKKNGDKFFDMLGNKFK